MSDDVLYTQRLDRIERTIRLEKTDRVPVVYSGAAFSPRLVGMSMAKYCEDPEVAADVTIAAMDRIGGFDGINAPATGRITPGLSLSWLSRIAVPGRDLPPESLWQVCEDEVMTHADYDTIIERGWQSFLAGYLPKVIDPEELRKFMDWSQSMTVPMIQKYLDHGYAVICGGLGTIPFEFFCGGRSMEKFFFDLYRMPDKVQTAMDRAFPEIIEMTIGTAKMSGRKGVWLGGWRSASALLAPKLWDRFVWPYYIKFANALLDAGLTPVLHWDQDWTRDLVRLQELPAKRCILNPDGMTDMKKFKELVGDRMAMMGDVPASLLSTGTPDEVYSYATDLIKLFGSTGLILSSGCDIPVNAKPENVKAMVAAGNESD